MKKIVSLFTSVVVTLNMGLFSVTTSANEINDIQNKQIVLDQLEHSKLKNFLNTQEGRDLYENIKNNAVGFSSSDSYVKLDSKGLEVPEACSENDYVEYLEDQSKLPQLYTVPSDSGNRYSWIKLSLEAYDFGNNEYMFSGFFEWLTKPYFTRNDVIALGHDSSIGFDTDSAFGFYQCEYYTSANLDPVYSFKRFDFSADQTNTNASTNGVAYKFKLQTTPDMYPARHTGAIHCSGQINAANGGNLQISYGHSEISIDFNIESAISWKSSGAISFNVSGSQDVATHGDNLKK